MSRELLTIAARMLVVAERLDARGQVEASKHLRTSALMLQHSAEIGGESVPTVLRNAPVLPGSDAQPLFQIRHERRLLGVAYVADPARRVIEIVSDKQPKVRVSENNCVLTSSVKITFPKPK